MRSFLKSSWPSILLAILSFTIHLAFLSYPAQVVFDEVHFGKFVAAYSTGQYYFDIHPPLGKLMIASFAKLTNSDLFSERSGAESKSKTTTDQQNPSTSSGYKNSSVFDFNNIGETMPADILFTLRFLPAFFGALFVLTFSWLAWLLSRDKKIALIAGFLILLDNAFLTQSKFILVDIFMLFFEVLTLCFFFLYQRQKSFSAKWLGYLFLTAIFFGLTISIKWTGLATIGIIGIILLAKIFSKKLTLYLSSPIASYSEQSEESPANAGRHKVGDSSASPRWKTGLGLGMTKWVLFKESLVSLLFLLLIGFTVYLVPFYIHFQLLPNAGTGDAFMSQQFQQELKYGRENIYQPLNFWQKFSELNKTMLSASAGLTTEHPFGSRWYSWPLNSKPVYYWNQETIDGFPGWKAKIYFSGNPALWWLAGFGVIFTLLAASTKKGRRHLKPISYILLLGYFANLLPFIFIKRVTFLYHYLPSLIYAVLILALWLGKFWNSQKIIAVSALILITAVFILLSPLSYGCPLPP